MSPAMEAMGTRMLFNECETSVRSGDRIYLAGVDDPNFYRADDIEKAASEASWQRGNDLVALQARER
jgi:uncharacterized protein